MRIAIPERFTLRQTLAVGGSLLCIQLAEGTDLLFAILTFAYVLIFAISYNVAGGIFYPSGAWILFTATETALIGIVCKALLLQPGERNLLEPNKTLGIYCVGLAGMGLAGWLSKTLRPRTGILANLSTGESLKQSAIGCLIFGLLLSYITRNAIHETATIGSALNQLDHFMQLAILLGTMYQIQKSGGKSSTNWIVWTAGLYLFALGMLNFSKEGMFTPFITWLLPAVILRFNFSKLQIVGAAVVLFFTLYYLVPYSQAGRVSRDVEGNLANNFDAALGYLGDLEGNTSRLPREPRGWRTFPIFRTFMMGRRVSSTGSRCSPLTDALITLTDQGSVYGLAPAFGTFANAGAAVPLEK